MAGQGWVEQSLAAAMLATAAYCAARLVLPRLRGAAGHADSDAVHVLMALTMGAMLLGVATPLWGGPLVLAFALAAAWFAVRAVRAAREGPVAAIGCTEGALGHVHLSVAGVAMIYMSGAVPGFGSVPAGVESAGLPALPAPSHEAGHAMTFGVGSAGSPGVDFALAGAVIFAALAAFAFLALGQLAASADRTSALGTQRSWPHRLTLCCQLAMAATMAHMIAAMI